MNPKALAFKSIGKTKVGNMATKVVCGWAGAVIKNANQTFGLER